MKKTFLALVSLLFATIPCRADLSGDGSAENPFLIASAADWGVFASNVNSGNAFLDDHYRLTADIGSVDAPVTQTVGTDDHPFRGTFDGGSNTIHVALSGSSQGTALFARTGTAAIQNLGVSGSVSSTADYAAGLVGMCADYIAILGCNVSADVAVSGAGHAGGIIGHAGADHEIYLHDNVFSGSISGFSAHAGGLVGWCGSVPKLDMVRCLFKGSFSGSGTYHPILCTSSDSSVTIQVGATSTGGTVYYLNTAMPTEENANLAKIGRPVSMTYVPYEWDLGVTAADGIVYYVPSAIVLTSETGYLELEYGAVITGTGGPDTHVVVKDGATVALRNVRITDIANDASHNWAGISCLGDATLILVGDNFVKGGLTVAPGIHIASGKTLTIQGDGTLNASSSGYAAGIGAGAASDRNCGNIVIAGGTVTATGGEYAAGIGSGFQSTCGTITISGGTVNATGGYYAPGIGSGSAGSCGAITISGGTVNATASFFAAGIGSGREGECHEIVISGGTVNATGNTMGPGIGGGTSGTCGDIAISGGTVEASGGQLAPGIGGGYMGTCGNIAISGGTVGASGGQYAPGIGSSAGGTCGDIALGDYLDLVTAEGGEQAPSSIGAATQGSCGTVTIGGVETGSIASGHYVYNPLITTIASTTDWDIIASRVNRGVDSYSGKTVTLAADITVSTIVGTADHAFCGIFDGDGHTLTVAIDSSDVWTAPFRFIKGATIRDLTVAGTVTSSANHAAGLVGACANPNTISNCTVAVAVNGSGYAGGIVGQGGDSTLTLDGCVFSGSVGGFTAFAGGLLGWGNTMTLHITNCLATGTFAPAGGGKYHPIAVKFANRTVTATVADAYYLNTVVPTATGGNVIPGAEGVPVSATRIDGHWTEPVAAADGNVYYGWTAALAGRLIARYSFDDAGNGGLNLLRASVGLDAIVRATQTTRIAGIGDISAVSDSDILSGLGSGDGAVAIPNGQHLAVPIPVQLLSGHGRPYTIVMRIRVPDTVGWRSLLNMPASNDTDAMVFLQQTTRNVYLKQYDKSSGAGIPATSGNVEANRWTTLAFAFGENATDIYRDGTHILHATGSLAGSFADCVNAGGYFLVGADDSYDDDLFYLSELRVYEGAVSLAGVLPGSGTPSAPYLISSVDDWNLFAANVSLGVDSAACYRLADDLETVAVPVGTPEHPFCGTFDGAGHTLTVAIDSTERCAAPFREIDGATIHDLAVAGSVTSSGYHAAGLVGSCGSDHPNTVSNCHVSVAVSAPNYAGGLIGHGGEGTLAIADCSFSGSVSGFASYAGGILGWCDGLTLSIVNCIFTGSFDPAVSGSSAGQFHPIACKYDAVSVAATVERAYYLNSLSPTATGSFLVPGADGTPVSETFIPHEWAKFVYAADGNVYYMEGEGVELMLAARTGALTLPSSCILMGTGGPNTHVVIEDGAIVTFRDVTIEGNNDYAKTWAGVTCLGNATIILEGENVVRGFHERYPGIHVPAGSTLTILGSGSLTASSNGQGAGIGGGWDIACGGISIKGGTVVATGGLFSAGIGPGKNGSCGDITIEDGIVSAEGDTYGPGIGSVNGSCGNITIVGGVVTAVGGTYGAGIGGGDGGSCGNITIRGGAVTAKGGQFGPGIGSGYYGSCGDITIGPDVFRVVATTGESISVPIGAGRYGSCGTVAVDSGLTDTSDGTTRIIERMVGLDSLAGNTIVADGVFLTGALGGNYRLSIPDGATVTISNVVVNGVDSPDCPWAGITCLGDATIVFEGVNIVRGFLRDYPGIHVPEGGTLTLRGSGLLAASSNGDGAGIGGGRGIDCGNIAINGGIVTATGGGGAAGIGGGDGGSCGDISFGPDVGRIVATCGGECDSPVGAGRNGSCGTVTVDDSLNDATIGLTRTIEPKILDLASLTEDVVVTDKYVVTGTLVGNYRVSIADGATVTLRDATILGVDSLDCPWAGITCLGDATIVIEGENVVRGFQSDYPGIHVPEGGTLAIQGFGSLTASGSGSGAGIAGSVALDDRLSDTTVGSTRIIAARVVDLSSLAGDVTVADCHYVTGTLGGNYKVSIADGATVTLRDATILGVNDSTCEWAGITCLGDASIILEGENAVRGFHEDYPGIYVPPVKTLTIRGNGSLAASSNGDGAGIGAALGIDCGNIVIEGGAVTATGSRDGAGIGGASDGMFGNIVIRGGIVTATGGRYAAGIGGGSGGARPCGDIVIAGGVVTATGGGGGIGGSTETVLGDIVVSGGIVTATAGACAAGIGSGGLGSCGDIVVSGGTVIATGGSDAPGIGSGYYASCGSIAVTGGTVTATGGEESAGIGAGAYESSCGDISFGSGIVSLTATCGDCCEDPIGAGLDSSCGTITVDADLFDTTDGPVRILTPKPLVNLGSLAADVTVADGYVITGTLSGNYKVSIADGATVTLRDATIDGVDDLGCLWAGITCLGDATIILEGENAIRGFQRAYPGIYVSPGGTLSIRGIGSLTASSNGDGAAIVGNVAVDYRLNDTTSGSTRILVPRIIDLGSLTGNTTVPHGYYVIGTLGGPYQVSIADGATVTLRDATIDGVDDTGCPWAGITCLGNATLVIDGKNSVRGFRGDCPGISVPAGRTLSVQGDGWLVASSNGGGAGIDGSVAVDGSLHDAVCGSTRIIAARVVDLGSLQEEATIGDGYFVTGTLEMDCKVSIADNATVLLCGATIDGIDDSFYEWAGITCRGNATIVIEGENEVRGFYSEYPGIYVPDGRTLTIRGGGSLAAFSNGQGAGIGGASWGNCGSIAIGGGTVTATGGEEAAGIGGGAYGVCGDITISGGTVTATGGEEAAGIGSGCNGVCGDITISGGAVTAIGGDQAAGIGSGVCGTCGDIAIGWGIVRVAGTCGDGCDDPIGAGLEGLCGTIDTAASLIDTTSGSTRTLTSMPTVDLGSLSKTETVVSHCHAITGTLVGNYKVTIASGATVTLRNVTILGVDDSDCPWAGITCIGDATFILEGENTVRGFYRNYPGIQVLANRTLTVRGSGSLAASSNGSAGGIAGTVVVDDSLLDTTSGSTRIIKSKTVNLGLLAADATIVDGQIITGTLSGNYQVSIAAGATVTLRNATINGIDDPDCPWAGLTCLGDATFILAGGNVVTGFHRDYPGIHVPEGSTLAVQGDGSLATSRNGDGAAIDGSVAVGNGMVDTTSGSTRIIASATVNLGSLTADVTIVEGQTITGTLVGDYKVSIADGATVTLRDATLDDSDINYIPNETFKRAGLTCLGDATIILEGDNTVVETHWSMPGILVPQGKTLVIRGSGSLTASSSGWAAGIGGGEEVACGNIVIAGGTVTASGGTGSAGIGGGNDSDCGDITLSGGTIVATGGLHGPGIGGGSGAACGTIAVLRGIVRVTATSGSSADPIGPGLFGSCTEVTVDSRLIYTQEGNVVVIVRRDIPTFATWAAGNGVTNAWDATDAFGIPNVFRYVFDVPEGAFTNPPLLSISFDASGRPVVLTPPLVNDDGFDISVIATDTLDGDNPVSYPLDASGETVIDETGKTSRFFRLKATEQ